MMKSIGEAGTIEALENGIRALKKKLNEWFRPEYAGSDYDPKYNSHHQTLVDSLKEMENDYFDRTAPEKTDYDALFPTELGKTPKLYEKKDSEQIFREANTDLAPKLTDSINKSNANYRNETLKLDAKTEQMEDQKENILQNVKENFLDGTVRNDKNMVMRGIVNSSINIVEKDRIYNEFVSETTKTIDKFDSELSHLKNSKSILEANYDEALRAYELKYALDLENKMSDIRVEEEKLRVSIDNYNAKIAKEEANYQKDREYKISALEGVWEERERKRYEAEKESERLGTITAEKSDELNKRLIVAKDYYSQLPSSAAKALVENNRSVLVNLLGSYYADLVNYVGKL